MAQGEQDQADGDHPTTQRLTRSGSSSATRTAVSYWRIKPYSAARAGSGTRGWDSVASGSLAQIFSPVTNAIVFRHSTGSSRSIRPGSDRRSEPTEARHAPQATAARTSTSGSPGRGRSQHGHARLGPATAAILTSSDNMLQLSAQRSTAAQPRSPGDTAAIELGAVRDITSGLQRRGQPKLGGQLGQQSLT